jgi:serine beta-lactamase-like protein LACTB, mitochondrial
MPAARSRVAAMVVVLGALVLTAAGAVAYWMLTGVPVHSDTAAVPSAVGTQVDRYAASIGEGRRLARALVVGENLPGLSVAVAADGAIVWAEGFGWADVDGREPVTPRTRFRLGAASKPLTAAAVALLHDRGRLDLDAPVQTYIPDYPRKPWPVSARQLLGDVAGVQRIRGDGNDAMPAQQCANLGEALSLVANEPLRFRPGSEHRYSIWGWVVVSVLVERAAREPFPAFMARELFRPLGMADTALEGPDGVPEGTTTLYSHEKGGRVGIVEPSEAQYTCLAGGGAIVSTPSDLVRFGSAVIKPGFLKAETIAAMQTPGRVDSGAPTDYALGWKVERVTIAGAPTRLVGHRGSPMGGAVSFLTFPDLGIVVAVTANTGSPGVDPLARTLAEVFVEARRKR